MKMRQCQELMFLNRTEGLKRKQRIRKMTVKVEGVSLAGLRKMFSVLARKCTEITPNCYNN